MTFVELGLLAPRKKMAPAPEANPPRWKRNRPPKLLQSRRNQHPTLTRNRYDTSDSQSLAYIERKVGTPPIDEFESTELVWMLADN